MTRLETGFSLQLTVNHCHPIGVKKGTPPPSPMDSLGFFVFSKAVSKVRLSAVIAEVPENRGFKEVSVAQPDSKRDQILENNAVFRQSQAFSGRLLSHRSAGLRAGRFSSRPPI